jgi:ankyrin repeat protein
VQNPITDIATINQALAFIQAGDDSNSKNDNQELLIHLVAAANIDYNILNNTAHQLKKLGADINIKDRHERTAFSYVISKPFANESVYTFLELDADPNTKDIYNNSLLQILVLNNNPQGKNNQIGNQQRS